MRDSFVFYRSFAEAINKLDEKDRLAVYEALCKYALDGVMPEENGVVGAMLTIMIPQIDANNKKYENGKKGGRPKTEEEPNETKAKPKHNQSITKPKPNNNQTETKAEPNVNVNVNDNENVNDNTPHISPHGGNEKRKKKVIPFSENKLVQEAFNDFYEMRIKIKHPLTDKAVEMLKTKLNGMTKDPVAQAKILDQSTFKSWQGIFEIGKDFTPLRDYKTEQDNLTEVQTDDDQEMSDEEWLELQRKLAEQENEIHTV